MLQFSYPWVFLLLPLPAVIYLLAPAYREPRPAVRVPFMNRLFRVTGQKDADKAALVRRTRLQKFQLIASWIAIVAALARPVWMDQPMSRELPMRDLLVAVDLSGSMDTKDFTDAAGATTDRLTAARQVLDQFLTRREGDRVGLIFFGSSAYVQAPFTDDHDVVRELLDEAQVRMLGPRTVLGDAMGVAIRMFERSEVDERVLIVLTDGNDTGSLVPPIRAAEIARDNGVTVYPVAMGDPKAAGEQALDEATLEAIAETTGGAYFHAGDRDELERIYQALDQLNPKQVETLTYRPERELYFWPAGFAILISLLFFGQAEFRSYLDSRRRGSVAAKDVSWSEAP